MIIPTLILLFAIPVKDAGSVSLAISIPTIIMGLVRYRRHPVYTEVALERRFIFWMAMGSILGAWVGSQLLRFVSGSALQIFLGYILLISAWKMAAGHKPNTRSAGK
jgi:uncharacterized membrane protein YfcA